MPTNSLQTEALGGAGINRRRQEGGVFDPSNTLAGTAQAALGGLTGGQPMTASFGIERAGGARETLGTITRTSARQNPISSEMRVQTALEGYQAQMQAAEVNRQQAQEALTRIEQATDQGVTGMQQAATASRARSGAAEEASRGRLGAQADVMRQSQQAAVSAAEQREQALGDEVTQRWDALVSDFQDTSALAGQQLIMGAREAYNQKRSQIQSMAASGAPGFDERTVGLAQASLENTYRMGLGRAIAESQVAYNTQRTQLQALGAQQIMGTKQALAAQTIGTMSAAAQAEVTLTGIFQNAEAVALHERGLRENETLQLEAQAELLRSRGADAEAALLTSPAMMAYAGDLSPLVNSAWAMYEDELDRSRSSFNRTVTGLTGGYTSAQAGAGPKAPRTPSTPSTPSRPSVGSPFTGGGASGTSAASAYGAGSSTGQRLAPFGSGGNVV